MIVVERDVNFARILPLPDRTGLFIQAKGDFCIASVGLFVTLVSGGPIGALIEETLIEACCPRIGHFPLRFTLPAEFGEPFETVRL